VIGVNPQSILIQENVTTPVTFEVSCANDVVPNDIVFVRDDNQGIWQVWVCDAQANNQTQLTFGGTNKNLPRWSPDGTKILYNGEVVDSIGIVISGELVTLNADGSSPDTLVFPIDFSPATGDWSPDGTKLVVLGTTTSNPTEPNYFIYDFVNISTPLLSYTNQPGWYDIRFSTPFWSPNGAEIVFSGENANLSTYHTPSVFTVPVTGGDAVFIANEQFWGFSYPQWSTDGSKLAFNGPFKHIWSCNSDGTNIHAVHEQGSQNGQPTWLPDGRIGFRLDNGTGLTIVNDDGTGLTTIGAGPNATFDQAHWNPSP
jgi:TolB protein